MKSAEGEKTTRRSEVPPAPQVNIKGISPAQNDRLTEFFSATVLRTRFYWLLASLARHQSVRTANAMAFDFFLALIPTLGLAGWAAAVMVGSESGTALGAIFRDLTPSQIGDFIGHQFEALSNAHLAPLAALAGWWLSSSAFDTLLGVFEEAFDCQPRYWIHRRLIALGLALLGMLLLGAGSGFYVWMAVLVVEFEPWLAPLKDPGLFSLLLLPGGLLAAIAFLALVYRVSIRRPQKKRVVWMGAITATLLGTIASAGLGYYAAYIARYTLFYGSLAALVVALFWLWWWSTAILIGAEINIALEDVSEAQRDTLRQSKPSTQRAALEFPVTPTQSPNVSGNSEGD